MPPPVVPGRLLQLAPAPVVPAPLRSQRSSLAPSRGARRVSGGGAKKPASAPRPASSSAAPFPPGYVKVGPLGSGGFGEVWEGRRASDGRSVAVKHVARSNAAGVEAMARELRMARRLYGFADADAAEGDDPAAPSPRGGGADDDAAAPRGIARLLCALATRGDRFLVFENGGATLAALAFEIKGEFAEGERVYRVRHRSFFDALRRDRALLRALLGDVAAVAALCAERGVSHCDLNPANILVELPPAPADAPPAGGAPPAAARLRVRVIDFGSAVDTDQLRQSLARDGATRVSVCGTPEYTAPELLHAVACGEDCGALLCHCAGAGDAFSLGAIFLEVRARAADARDARRARARVSLSSPFVSPSACPRRSLRPEIWSGSSRSASRSGSGTSRASSAATARARGARRSRPRRRQATARTRPKRTRACGRSEEARSRATAAAPPTCARDSSASARSCRP